MAGNPERGVGNGKNQRPTTGQSGYQDPRFSAGTREAGGSPEPASKVTGNEYPAPNITPGNEGFRNPSEEQFGRQEGEPYRSQGQGAFATSPGGGGGVVEGFQPRRGEVGFGEEVRGGPEPTSEAREHVRRIGYMARDRLVKTANDRKSTFAHQLDGVASMLDDVTKASGAEAGPEQKLASTAANAIRQVSHSLNSRSAEEILDILDHELRARPGVAIAGCLVLGFLGARFLRT
ncbi:MAG: hypothetical protein AB2A00_23585 [Myxococcota bacterium]